MSSPSRKATSTSPTRRADTGSSAGGPGPSGKSGVTSSSSTGSTIVARPATGASPLFPKKRKRALGEDDDDQDEGSQSGGEGPVTRRSASSSPSKRRAKSSSARGDSDDGSEGDEDVVEEEDGGEETEEEEASGSGASRPRKRSRVNFLDIEAEDEDSVSEEDEQDEEAELADEFVDDAVDDGSALLHQRLDRRRAPLFGAEDEVEDIVARMQQRYGVRGRPATAAGAAAGIAAADDDDEAAYADEDEDEGPALGPPPTNADPKLYHVKCKPGKERELAIAILRNVQNPLRQIGVCGVVVKDELKGSLYIEATKPGAVQKAIEGIQGIYRSKVGVVPLAEMIDVVHVKPVTKAIRPGQYVRVKRTKYSGDIGQVVEFDEGTDMVTVKLVPRIDYSSVEDGTVGRGKRGKAAAVAKPPQKMFNPAEAAQLDSSIQFKGKFYIFRNEKFRDGYAYKEFRRPALNTEKVEPSMDEMTRFLADAATPEALEQATAAIAAPNAFTEGDKVVITEGDLRSLKGVVLSVDSDAEEVTIQTPEAQEPLVFSPTQLRRTFSEGDRVLVVRGRHKGDAGVVIQEPGDDDIVHILSDQNVGGEAIRVFGRDLREFGGTAAPGATIAYDIHELVVLDQSTVGVIVKIEGARLKVLDQNDQLRTVTEQEIRGRKESRDSTLDGMSNPMEQGAVVQILEGPRQNSEGRVLHVVRSSIFVHCRNVPDNNGVLLLRGADVVSLGATGRGGAFAAAPRSRGGMRGSRASFGGGGYGARGGGGRAFNAPRDPLLTKTVILTEKPYKGYRGTVVAAMDGSVRVELQTNNRKVLVDRNKVREVDPNRSSSSRPWDGGQAFGTTPAAVPSYGDPYASAATTPYGQTPYGAGAAQPTYTPAPSATDYAYGASPYEAFPSHSASPSYGGAPTAYGAAPVPYGNPEPAYGAPAMTAVPQKSDTVRVLGGMHVGREGELISIEGTDGVVRLGELGYQIVPLASLSTVQRQ